MDKASDLDQKIPGSSPGGVVPFVFIFDEKEQLPLPNKKNNNKKKTKKKNSSRESVLNITGVGIFLSN